MGLSLGREGPSIQIGGATGKIYGKILKKPEREMPFIITAGASAGLSAAFNAPISGTLFALEEIHKSFSPLVLLPAIVASVIANFLSFKILGTESAFSFVVSRTIPIDLILLVLITGVVCGIIGVIFNIGIVKTKSVMGKFKTTYRLLFTMGLSIVVGFLFYDLVSGGHGLLENLAENSRPINILLLLLFGKMIYTWICFGTGIQGGIFLPTLVCGGITGAIYFSIFSNIAEIHPYYINFIIIGMAATLTSVVRAPIMGILLVTEMTGSFSHLISLCTASIAAYLVGEILNNPPIYESLYEAIVKKDHIKEDQYIGDYIISANSPLINTSLRDLNLPEGVLIISIKRDGEIILPIASTTLLPGDSVTIISKKNIFYKVDEVFTL